MGNGEGILKRELKAIFSWATAGRREIPIFWGPLRGMRLPREVACRNLHMLINGYETDIISEIVSSPHSIQHAYDIGAHCGLLSLALSKRVNHGGKVFAFEPFPENYRHIQELINVNQLSSVIIAIELALADTDGEQILLMGDTPFLNLLERTIGGPTHEQKAKVPVKVAQLDTLVFRSGIPPPDFIKLDVEGGELQVLKGARRMLEVYFPEILIEIHGPRNGEQVWDLLEPLGYSWSHLVAGNRHPISKKREVLCLFSKKVWTRHFLLEKTKTLH